MVASVYFDGKKYRPVEGPKPPPTHDDDQVSVDLNYCGLTMQTTRGIARKWARWIRAHKYGPYHIEMMSGGIVTTVVVTDVKSGSKIDLTDYSRA